MLTIKRKVYEKPAEGTHDATLVGIENLGMKQTRWGSKDLVKLVWKLDHQTREDGKPLTIPQTMSKSLDEKSTLYGVIRGVTGRNPGDEFDLHSLGGAKVSLTIGHSEPDEGGTVWARIKGVTRRSKSAMPAKKEANAHGLQIDDSEVPFPRDGDNVAFFPHEEGREPNEE